jgi:hypothetical protein
LLLSKINNAIVSGQLANRDAPQRRSVLGGRSSNPKRRSWLRRSNPVYNNRVWPDNLRIDSVDSFEIAIKDPLPIYDGKKAPVEPLPGLYGVEIPPPSFEDLEKVESSDASFDQRSMSERSQSISSTSSLPSAQAVPDEPPTRYSRIDDV